MPGLHSVIGYERCSGIKESDFNCTLHEPYFRLDVIIQSSDAISTISYHEGYPVSAWQNEDFHILLEGLVYNRKKDEVFDSLKEIAEAFEAESDFNTLVKRFVESSDGDFIVQIFSKESRRLLIFNDYLGRLALYYYCDGDLCVASKELKTILHFMPRIQFDKPALAEYLMFEYPLGNKTIFKDVYRLQASEFLIARIQGQSVMLDVQKSADFDFVLKNPFSSKEESIKFLKATFLESVENRVRTLKENGYAIIADLSGGYDTRAVIGGLSKFTSDVDYFTFEYIQDESPCANAVFRMLDSPGSYHKLSFSQGTNDHALGELVYRTDGLVNHYSTSVCYHDVEQLKRVAPRKSARFSGLGGEFIRHPYVDYYRSLLEICEKGLYSTLSLEIACQIVKLDPDDYKKRLGEYFDSYPEKTPQDRLKRLYYEYYHNYVGAAAEDRERIHFWTVQPLWSLPFSRAIFSRVPLNWVGYRYYRDFLYSINPTLIRAPIYNSNVSLESPFSMALHEARCRTVTFFQAFGKSRYARVYKTAYTLFKDLRHQTITNGRRETLLQGFYRYYNGLSSASDIFEPSVIRESLFRMEGTPFRILTLMIYLTEVQHRYREKF
ncbi:MAG: hypothetical protein RJR34_09530 [Candidatus Methanoculleus thermohydrogenotrophicum]|nr:hypothetical protein [Candidatus Methanoculleus thermohydrogenotrophicum]